jgi:hypothetical protein
VSGAEEVAGVVATKQQLDELTRSERESREPVAVPPEERSTAAGAADRPAAWRPLGARLLEPIPLRLAGLGAGAWMVLLAVGIAVEPPPADPGAVDPWFVSILDGVFLAAFLAAFAGFGLRRRWGPAASLVASGVLLLFTVMCPMSGHHTNIGAWWVVQLGCSLGLVATSTIGLRRG